MKNRILTFIIGILTGAIIITLVFLIFNKPKIENFPQKENGQMQIPNEVGEMAKPENNMKESAKESDDRKQTPK